MPWSVGLPSRSGPGTDGCPLSMEGDPTRRLKSSFVQSPSFDQATNRGSALIESMGIGRDELRVLN